MLTVVSQDRCMPCKMTAKKLNELGVAHNYVDVSDVPDLVKSAMDQGALATPLVFKGREFLWSGYRPDRLAALTA